MPQAPKPVDDDDAYCATFLSSCDRDRYLANLFAPADRRAHLNGLHAFAADLAAIRNRASEPLIGEIRLQWWRDTLAEMVAGTTIGVPIADALNRAIAAADLPKSTLESMIDAREAELGGEHLTSLTGWEDHLAATDGAVIEMGSLILIGRGAPDDTLRAAGIAIGLTRAMACIASPSAATGQLPLDLQTMHGMEPDATPMNVTPALNAVLADLIATARHHLECAKERVRSLSREALPAFLPLSTVEPDLSCIERAPFTGGRGALRRQLAIYFAARRGRV